MSTQKEQTQRQETYIQLVSYKKAEKSWYIAQNKKWNKGSVLGRRLFFILNPSKEIKAPHDRLLEEKREETYMGVTAEKERAEKKALVFIV